MTKEEAEMAASNESEWKEVAITKDGSSASIIADILEKRGFNDVARLIRGMSVCVFSPVCIKTVQDPFEKAQ